MRALRESCDHPYDTNRREKDGKPEREIICRAQGIIEDGDGGPRVEHTAQDPWNCPVPVPHAKAMKKHEETAGEHRGCHDIDCRDRGEHEVCRGDKSQHRKRGTDAEKPPPGSINGSLSFSREYIGAHHISSDCNA